MADNCPGGTWSAAFSGNANGNPSPVTGIANGSPSSIITFQKGATTVILSATDVQGNNATTCSFTVTVNDNENPTLTCPTDQTVTTTSNGTGDCTGSYSIPNPMADNCPGGTWSAAFSGNANGNPGAVTGIANGSASGSITFQKGATTVILSATDAQGNNATTCSFTVTVNDNENPTVTCPAPQTIYTNNNGAGDCTAGYAIPNPMADNCTGGTWGVSFSGNPVSNPNAITNLPDGFNIEYIALQKGNTTLTYTATDASGNAATPCSYTVTVIDNEAPMLYCSINQTATTSSNGTGDCTGVYTIMNPLADNCPGATWGATFSGNANGMPANFSGIAEGSNSTALTIYRGVTNVTLSAVDAQGNPAATCNFTITLIDNEAPVLTCPTNQTVTTASNGTGDCTGGYAIPNTVLSDNCTGATWGATFSGNPNGIPSPLSGISAGSGSGILTFPIGVTTATLTATDQQGNTASCSFTVAVNDNEAPGLTCPTNQTVYTAANPLPSCTGLYAIANPMTDNCMGGTWSAAFTNNANGLPNTVSNVPRGSGSGNIAFSLGTTTVTLSAADAASNNAITCSFTVQVIDNRPPTITCPTNISVPADPGICGAVVNFTVPFVLDDCSVAPNITAVPASGSIFSAGATTTVNVTAADAANNNANCSFTVTVTDTQAPVANCPNNIVQTADASGCTSVVNFTIPNAADNCSASSVAVPASGSSFGVGTTTVTVTATDAASNTGTCSFTVTINNPVVASISGATTGCGSVTLTASGGSAYVWIGGDTPNNAQNTFTASGDYTVTVSNGGCSATASVVVTVTPATSNTTTETGCGSYTWAVNGQTYTTSGIYNFTSGCHTEILDLTILPATSNTTQVTICLGYYWAVNGQTYTQSGIYTHVTGCHTEILNLTVTPNTTLLASVSGTVTNVCEGQTLSLTATGGTDYEWSGPNGFSASTATITRPNADVSMSGLYTVTVSAGGCSSVITVNTTVQTNPSGTISGATSYCTGQTINLSASGGTTYQWGGPGGFSSGTATISRFNATAGMAGVYSVTITNTYGCTTTTSVNVLVGTAPVVTISGNTTACTGGIISLTASPAGAANYQWSGPGFTQNGPNATMTRTATTGTGGVYSVTVTDTNGCTGMAAVSVTLTTSTVSATISGATTYCAGTTISLTASGGTNYQWTTPDAQTLSGATISRPNATTAMGGVYVVTVTNASGCAATTSRTVTVHALPNAVISGNTTYCVGGILSLTASGGTSYQWAGPGFTSTAASISRTNLTTAMAGTYTVTVTGTGNCKSTASVVVTVNAKPVVSINGSTAATGSLSVCAGTMITLTASGGVTYAWSGPGGFTSSDAVMTRPAVSGLVANGGTGGTYMVTVTNAAGCTSTASRSVTILAAPVVNTSGATNVCAPASFTVSATGGGTYLWNGPNGFTASTASFTRNPSNTTMSGAYNVTVTATNGCKTTASRTVTVAACKDAAEDIPATTLTAYPNPSDGHTTVSFTSYAAQHIKLVVYAVDGKEVAVLFDAEAETQTEYNFELDLHSLPAGSYHAVLQQADGSSTQVRLVIVR